MLYREAIIKLIKLILFTMTYITSFAMRQHENEWRNDTTYMGTDYCVVELPDSAFVYKIDKENYQNPIINIALNSSEENIETNPIIFIWNHGVDLEYALATPNGDRNYYEDNDFKFTVVSHDGLYTIRKESKKHGYYIEALNIKPEKYSIVKRIVESCLILRNMPYQEDYTHSNFYVRSSNK